MKNVQFLERAEISCLETSLTGHFEIRFLFTYQNSVMLKNKEQKSYSAIDLCEMMMMTYISIQMCAKS